MGGRDKDSRRSKDGKYGSYRRGTERGRIEGWRGGGKDRWGSLEGEWVGRWGSNRRGSGE